MKPKMMFSMYGVVSAMAAPCTEFQDANKRQWEPVKLMGDPFKGLEWLGI